jgi:hypothetical protein
VIAGIQEFQWTTPSIITRILIVVSLVFLFCGENANGRLAETQWLFGRLYGRPLLIYFVVIIIHDGCL